MRKKLTVIAVTFIIALGTLSAATQVYAATVLNTNIFDLIKSQFTTVKSNNVGKVGSDMQSLGNEIATDINKHVSDKSKQALDEIETIRNSEVNRGTQDLKNYSNQVKQEVDTAIDSEKTKVQTGITNEVNTQIQSTKTDIEAQIQQSISDNLKPRQ